MTIDKTVNQEVFQDLNINKDGSCDLLDYKTRIKNYHFFMLGQSHEYVMMGYTGHVTEVQRHSYAHSGLLNWLYVYKKELKQFDKEQRQKYYDKLYDRLSK